MQKGKVKDFFFFLAQTNGEKNEPNYFKICSIIELISANMNSEVLSLKTRKHLD